MTASTKHYTHLDGSLLDTIVTLDLAIFPSPLSRETFESELRTRHNLCILVAVRDEEPCGYKIGYEYSSRVFCSWSGGVLPGLRRQGIARMLMAEQHRIALGLGYAVVRTSTKNKYREMLLLNIASGFDVTGINHNSGEKFPSIILEKALKDTSSQSTE